MKRISTSSQSAAATPVVGGLRRSSSDARPGLCRAALVFGLLASGCSFGDTLEPYYAGGSVEISSLSVQSEEGNIGGQVITISGSGFSSEPGENTVVFGSQNATVLSASETQLEVRVPRGPIEGGFVDVAVGTADAQVRAEDAYQYDTTLGTGIDLFENEVAYITVTDDYFSCGGGIGSPLAMPELLAAYGWVETDIVDVREKRDLGWTHEDSETTNFSPHETFCNEGLTFGGYVGIEGRSEILDFAYPRLHNIFVGYRNGFGGSFDLSPGEWSVQVPSQDVVGIDIENFYDDLRTEIDDFVITNVDVLEHQTAEERSYCADMSALVDVSYEPQDGDVGADGCPLGGTSVSAPFYMEADCSEQAAREYDLAEMRFCQVDEYQNTRSYRNEAEWPIGEYFFKGWNPDADFDDDGSEGELDPFHSTTIQLDVPEAGISGVQVELPEAAIFQGTSGWNTDAFGFALTDALSGAYGLFGFNDTCADDDGDGQTTSADIAATVSWMPSDVELTQGDSVRGGRTFVRFTITAAGFGWYGGEGAVMKATITVDDEHNVDEETGLSTLEIPASVLYQVPSILQNFGGVTDIGEESAADECGDYIPGAEIQFEWASPDVVNYGFVITQIERVTEYAVEAPSLGGDLVFAYSSGDIGYTVFGTASDGSPSWLNPADGTTSCGDCADNDGDGWNDIDDPDCMVMDLDDDDIPDSDVSLLSEDNSLLGRYTCNDLIDNDDDGLIDSEDDDCASATDDESNCNDRADNDEDGYADSADPDCEPGGPGYEDGYSVFECNDGEDNDGDGLIDTEEPECTRANFREITCNNGIDDDNDGLTDADDPECEDELDQIEDTIDSTATTCNDDLDNDGDGWVDLDDPDCPTLTRDEVGYGTTECNDNIDNDGQGDIDAADPSCMRLGAEGTETPPFAASCADSTDNDSDGYIDGNDPDCEYAPYSLEQYAFHEASFYPGVPGCYNGVDDDLNGDVDSADPDCVNSFSEPSGFTWAEDPARPDCTNGQDDDGDGWVDSSDPDCGTGDTEDGYGTADCNDGTDNDGDTFIDAADADCADASDTED